MTDHRIIGLKYCGGCNPGYDRGAAVRKLKVDLQETALSFENFDPQKQYETCLLVRGCNRDCVSTKGFANCRRLLIAVCEDDFNMVKEELYKQENSTE